MKLSDLLADLLVSLYGLNRRTLKLRGGYRVMILASRFLPKLRAYPIHFPETGTVKADVNSPDTYWLLNSFVGDTHSNMLYLYNVIEASIKPGQVIWDIGANMGYLGWRFGQARFQLQAIHQFEPNPTPYQIAKEFMEQNPIVHVHNYGLGGTKGSAALSFHKEGDTGGGSMKHLPEGGADAVQIECRVERGDDLVSRGEAQAPDFIKIDVEGFECEVIQGLAETLETKRPTVCFEFIFLTQPQIEGMVPKDYKLAYISGIDGKLTGDYDTARQRGAMDAVMAPVDSPLWAKLV